MNHTALMSLAEFLNTFTKPDFVPGRWIFPPSDNQEITTAPYVDLDDTLMNFIKAAYKDNWLDIAFDWPEWASSSEAAKLRDDPRALETASPADLSRLLTVCIRRDKFVEGALLSAFESGLILRIVRRAAELANSKPPSPLRKLSALQAGGLGEVLALAKLNSLGIPAYMSPEGAPGHDIIAIIGKEAKSIEVKTRQYLYKPTEITRWPVNLETKGDADFFLFVELNLKTISPTFYLLTNEQARAINKSFGKGQGNCYPAQVRLLVKKNDFSSIAEAKTMQEDIQNGAPAHNSPIKDHIDASALPPTGA